MKDGIQYCPVCEGIALHWNKLTQEWTARYVEGGAYCTCSDEELALANMSYRVVPNETEGDLPEGIPIRIERTSAPPDGFSVYASLAEAQREAIKSLGVTLKTLPPQIRRIRKAIRALMVATVEAED